MAPFEIPNSQGQVRQVNKGDIFGELWLSKNIDLNNSPGKVRVSKKLKKVWEVNETVGGVPDTITGTVRALLVYTDIDSGATRKHYYAVTNNRAFRCSLDDDPRDPTKWSLVSGTSGDFSDSTDAVVFDGLIRISTSTNIARFNGDSSYSETWWTADISGTALTTNKPHTLHVHRGGQETILVTDANRVRYYNSTAGHTTLTLATRYVANTLASGVDTIWVGTYSETSDDAYVYEFNIGNTLPNAAYKVNGQAVMSMEVIDNIPYVITDRGHIQAFNGNGFVTVASFPYAATGKTLSGVVPGIYTYTSPPVYPKGMRAKDRSLFINFATTGKNSTSQPIDERTPAGVWEYNVDTGVLHHRASFSPLTADAGMVRQNEAGPLLVLDSDDVQFLAGAGATQDGLYADSTETPEGYIVTPEYYGDSIQQAWDKITAVAHLNSGTITVKYRTEKRASLPVYINSATWASATTFTTTGDISLVEPGDEVEVISGYGAGKLAHVVSITGTTTKTVTIDESIGSASQSVNVRFQNWTKLPTEFTSGKYLSIGIGEVTPWIQFKVQLSGDVELQKLITKGNAKTQHS